MGLKLEDIKNRALAENKKIYELVIEDQMKELSLSKKELIDEMMKRYVAMKESVVEGLKEGIKSISGITGGDAHKLYEESKKGNNICGEMFSKALAYALAVSEYNASMGKIVAAPTAGSSGIMPAILISMQENYGFDDEMIAKVMFTSSYVGLVIADNFCISGAGGGCQAECGTSSAMASAAIIELLSGDPEKVLNAIAITIKSVLGLVCDPVAGLVEVPCIKRNASGVATAYMSAQLALAGIESVIPADETILSMKRVGESMSKTLKETAEGGLAISPTGLELKCRLFNN